MGKKPTVYTLFGLDLGGKLTRLADSKSREDLEKEARKLFDNGSGIVWYGFYILEQVKL